MNRISCCVDNCSHNKNQVCYANVINVVGENAQKDSETCCGSFLDKAVYGTLENSVNSYSETESCDSIICNACNCKHNDNSVCKLDNINVNSLDSSVSLYSETCCGSFEEE